GVPVRVDHLHVYAIVDGEVDRGVGLLRESMKQRPRRPADVDLREGRITEADRGASERVLGRRVRVAEEAEMRERVDEARDGGPSQPRPRGELLMRQPAVASTESTQHIEH